MAIVTLAVIVFLFDNLMKKRSVPLTSQVFYTFKNSYRTPVKNCWFGKRTRDKRTPLMFTNVVKWMGEQTYPMLLQIQARTVN